MKISVKNMVCPRCISSVEQLLHRHHLPFSSVRLGEVDLVGEPDEKTLHLFAEDLKNTGFELLDDKKTKLIEKVKTLLIQKAQQGDIEEHFSVRKFLTENIFKDYSSLSKLFSGVEGITIEQFFILQKIEKTKEWLIYNEISLSQIAFKLGYSSTQHLSSQFKKITGMTPSHFKELGSTLRKSLDDVKE